MLNSCDIPKANKEKNVKIVKIVCRSKKEIKEFQFWISNRAKNEIYLIAVKDQESQTISLFRRLKRKLPKPKEIKDDNFKER